MRVPALTLACLSAVAGLLPPPAHAAAPPSPQEAPAGGAPGPMLADTRQFDDEAYNFSFDVPFGLTAVPDEVRATFPGQALPNRPRSDSRTERLEHNFLWTDSAGPGGDHRQIELMLMDESKWAGPGDFQRWLESNGMTLEKEEEIPRPVGPGLLYEVSFANPTDQRPMRSLVVYIARLNRYAVMKMQCYGDAWEQHGPSFRKAVETIRFREMVAAPPPAAALEGEADDGHPWLRVEVLGSLLLAGVVLASMAAGMKAKA